MKGVSDINILQTYSIYVSTSGMLAKMNYNKLIPIGIKKWGTENEKINI